MPIFPLSSHAEVLANARVALLAWFRKKGLVADELERKVEKILRYQYVLDEKGVPEVYHEANVAK